MSMQPRNLTRRRSKSLDEQTRVAASEMVKEIQRKQLNGSTNQPQARPIVTNPNWTGSLRKTNSPLIPTAPVVPETPPAEKVIDRKRAFKNLRELNAAFSLNTSAEDMTLSASTSSSTSPSGSNPSSLSSFPSRPAPPPPPTKPKLGPLMDQFSLPITADDIKETAKSLGIKLTGSTIRGKNFLFQDTDKKKTREVVDIESELEELLEAASQGNKKHFKKTIERSADYAQLITAQSIGEGQSVIHVLAAKGHLVILEWVFRHKNYKDLININLKDNSGWTALHAACYEKKLSIIEFLLQHENIDVNAKTNSKNIPLHYLARHIFDDSEKEQFKKIIKTMVSKNVDMNAQSDVGSETPLFQAALRSNVHTVEVLLSNGCNINMRNSHNETVLHYAVGRGDLSLVILLTTWRPSVLLLAKGPKGTALDVAAQSKSWQILSFLNGISDIYLGLDTVTLVKILGYACSVTRVKPAYQLARWSTVCKKMSQCVNDDILWQPLYKGMWKNTTVTVTGKANGMWKQEYKKEILKMKEKIQKEKLDKEIKLKLEYYKKKTYNLKSVKNIQRVFRGWRDRKKVQKLKKLNEQRTKIAHELLETETTYVNGIKIIVNHYMKSLQEHSRTSKPIANPFQIKTIFSEIEVILYVNNQLYSEMEKRMAKWHPNQRIGDMFLDPAVNLRLYASYVNNFDRSLAAIAELNQDKEFQNWLRERESTHRLHTLDSVLILPVQRIPRYSLLIEQLLKNTWESHPDYDNLIKAQAMVKDAANYVNEKKRDVDNKKKVLELFSAFKNKEAVEANPGRIYLRECDVTYYTAEGQQKLRLYLFSDVFVLAKSNKKVVIFDYLAKINTVETISALHFFGASAGKSLLLRGDNKEHLIEYSNVEDAYVYFDEFNRAIKREGELKVRKGKADLTSEGSNSDNSMILSELASLREQVASLTLQLGQERSLRMQLEEKLKAAEKRPTIGFRGSTE